MNENNNQFQQEFQKGRGSAMIFGGIVYVGVVIAATTLFISFILLAFPNDAYFTRFVMGVAGLLVGGSMIAFPVALHNWAVSGTHRAVAVGLYYGEMLIVALNTVVSFASLLFKFAGMALPPWVAWYEPFSIISIVYTLIAWGTIFLLDPHIKAKAREHAALVKFNDRVSLKLDEFLDSIEGEDAIARMAESKIQEKFLPDLAKRRHFGSGNHQNDESQVAYKPVPVNTSLARNIYYPVQKTPDNLPVWRCPNCTSDNLGDGKFCGVCGAPREIAFSSNGKGKANP